jgi:hydroxyacylglutathione hydrolase
LKNKLANTLLQFKQIPAFQDNYLWVIQQDSVAWAVDPGDASPIIQLLEKETLTLGGILITHHHNDHIGGVEQLLQWSQSKNKEAIPVIGPRHQNIKNITLHVQDGDSVSLFPEVSVQVLSVPGHTLSHIAYFLPASPAVAVPRLYCGDTLFSCGCGRLFEGSPEQMYQSLQKFAALPDQTLVCCAHEYTLSNIRFAQTIEPTNTALTDWAKKATQLRASSIPTVPTTIGFEKQVNPFLRCDLSEIQHVATQQANYPIQIGSQTLAIIRKMKDEFK